jgi:hypothetical protein
MIKGDRNETQAFDPPSHGGMRDKSRGSKHTPSMMMIKGVQNETQAFDLHGIREKDKGPKHPLEIT